MRHLSTNDATHVSGDRSWTRTAFSVGAASAAAVVLLGLAVTAPVAEAKTCSGKNCKPLATASPTPTTSTASPTPTTSTASPTPTTSTASPTASPTATTTSPTPTATTSSPVPVQTTTSASPTPTTSTVTPTATGYTYVTPSTGYREALLTPEGARVEIANDVTTFSAAQVADLLEANAWQLGVVGPKLKVKVQTTYATMTSSSAGTSNGVYAYYSATMWLDARSTSSFTAWPAEALTHEYGHAWSGYHYYLTQQGTWAKYLAARGLTGDSRLDTTYGWQVAELIADDYRLLFGTSAATTPCAYIQPALPDPRTVAGLKDFFMTGWTTP